MLGLEKSKIFEKEKARELQYNALRSLCMSASPVLLKEFAAFNEYIGQMDTDFFDWHFVLRSKKKIYDNRPLVFMVELQGAPSPTAIKNRHEEKSAWKYTKMDTGEKFARAFCEVNQRRAEKAYEALVLNDPFLLSELFEYHFSE